MAGIWGQKQKGEANSKVDQPHKCIGISMYLYCLSPGEMCCIFTQTQTIQELSLGPSTSSCYSISLLFPFSNYSSWASPSISLQSDQTPFPLSSKYLIPVRMTSDFLIQSQTLASSHPAFQQQRRTDDPTSQNHLSLLIPIVPTLQTRLSDVLLRPSEL